MRDLLPQEIFEQIRNRYLSGVTSAELAFDLNRGDEDSLTGALGQALYTPATFLLDRQGNKFGFSIFHYKIRGRGNNAPEKRIGADGIFQIEVRDQNGELLRTKGLLFQAKKEWIGSDAKLGEQAALIAEPATKGMVIDYSKKGYMSCSAETAARAKGVRTRIESSSFKRLAERLADEFLPCSIGVEGMRYDDEKELLIDPTLSKNYPLPPQTEVIETEIVRLRLTPTR